MKYILTTGCSFTNFNTTWSDYLEGDFKDKNTSIVNLGYKGNSNDIILRGVITTIEKMLNEGKEISGVIIQLTTMQRKFMISKLREYLLAGDRSGARTCRQCDFIGVKKPPASVMSKLVFLGLRDRS